MNEQSVIRRYLTFSVLNRLSLGFISATYIIFLKKYGLDDFQRNLVNAVFWSVLLLTEMPTGAMADVFGRRRCVVLSALLVGLGSGVYGLGTTFAVFALAEAIAAIGKTLVNGALEAWLSDSLKELEVAEHRFVEILAKDQVVGAFFMIAATLIGTKVHQIDVRLPWLLCALSSLVLAVSARIWMQENQIVQIHPSFWHKTKEGYKLIIECTSFGWSKPEIRKVLLGSALLMFSVQAPNMQWPILLGGAEPNLIFLGLVGSMYNFTMLMSGWVTKKLMATLHSERSSLFLCYLVAGLGIFLTASVSTALALPMFVVHELARAPIRPLQKACLNQEASRKNRASLQSLGSVFGHVGGLIGLILSGWLAKYYSMQAAWMLSGMTLVVGTLYVSRRK